MRGEKLSFHYAPAMIAFVSLVLYGAAAVVNYFTDPERFWDAVVYSLYSLGFMVLYAAAGVIHDLRPEYGVYAASVAAVLSVYAIYPGLVAMCWGGLISLAVWLLYFVRLAVENPGLYGRSRLWGVPQSTALADRSQVARRALQRGEIFIKTLAEERREKRQQIAWATTATTAGTEVSREEIGFSAEDKMFNSPRTLFSGEHELSAEHSATEFYY